MMIQRCSAAVLLAAALVMSGCNKKDKAAGAEGGSGAPANPPAATPPPATPPAAPPAGDDGPPVALSKLAGLVLPVPKGAPEKGVWVDAPAPTGGGDGDRLVNFTDGPDIWFGVRFLDCRHPAVKAASSKPAAERGDFAFCFDAPTGKLKDFPLYSPNDNLRVVKAGHITILAGPGASGEGKIKPADTEAWLEGLNLSRISKL